MRNLLHSLLVRHSPARSLPGLILLTALLGLAGNKSAAGQTDTWDSLLSNSYWYVPQENLLSYITSGANFIDPAPTVAWDQTLWSLGTATNGVFTGSSQATFYVNPLVSIVSTNTIKGVATTEGQIRMQFTPTGGGAVTIGIGQFRSVNNTTAMEMQMITGSAGDGGILFSHWAYMLSYDPDDFTPPDPEPNSNLVSEEWVWTLHTSWVLASDDVFGTGGAGSFTITNYRNGYFWGPGTGPEDTSLATFSFLGSITPEGNVLFNILDQEANLTSLTGQIVGDGLDGQMLLRQYQFDGTDANFGSLSAAHLVPEPSGLSLLVLAAAFLSLCRKKRFWRNGGKSLPGCS